MRDEAIGELLFHVLQAEQDRARVYEAALRLGLDEAVQESWAAGLSQSRTQEETLHEMLEALGLDPQEQTWRRDVARCVGDALIAAVEKGAGRGTPQAAKLLACECVYLAETREQLTWDLVALVASRLKGHEARLLRRAHRKLESRLEQPVHGTRESARELWAQALGVSARAAARSREAEASHGQP